MVAVCKASGARVAVAKVFILALWAGVCSPAAAQISGFNNGSGWTLNGSNATGYNSSTAPGVGASSLPTLAGATAQLLPDRSFSGGGGAGAASSVFYNTAQPVAAFNASFTYQASGGGGAGLGDGVAFVIQGGSRDALGSLGGNGATTLAASFTTAFSYNAATPGNDFIIAGVSPVYSPTGALNLAGNQHPIAVTLSYNTITLYETITDTVTGTTYRTSKNVDINLFAGGQTAYVGFTAGSSGAYAGVTISNFTFTPVTIPGIAGIPKPVVPNGWGTCVQPNGWGGPYYQQTGVPGDWYFSPAQQAQFQQSGMKLIRADLLWDNVEFSKGVYNYNYYDGLVNNLQGSGVTVMFILDYENALYTGNPPGGFNPGAMLTQPALGAFANFCANAATHFQGKNVIFEIWNEPNLAYGYTGSQYSTFAVPAEQAMRAANPNVTIIGPAEAELDPGWRQEMLRTGSGNLLNAFSFHPYAYPPESMLSSSGYQGGFPGVAADLVAYPPGGGVPLAMMASESGIADNLQKQASYYTRIYLTDQLFGLALNTNFKYQDAQPADNDPANSDYGLIYADNTPKPAYTAVKNLLSSLNGYEQIGRINTGNSNIYASIYQKGASLAEAIWTSLSPGDSALPYVYYLTAGSAEYNRILNAAYANSPEVIAPPSFTTQFTVTAPATSVGGVPRATPFQITVTALDEYNNPTPGYSGTVHITSTDPAAVLPPDARLTNGVGTFVVTLNTAAWEYVTATDTLAPSITNAFCGLVTTAHTLAASPSSLAINRGASVQSTVSVIAGFSPDTTLSLSGVPAGINATLSATSFAADGTCFLTLAASPAAPLGSASIQVNATSGSSTRTLTIPVTIGPGTGLTKGGFLATGQYLVSPAGVCYLVQQADGNLVLYSGSDPTNQGSAIWASNVRAGGGKFYTVLQGDGNLVTYAGASPAQAAGALFGTGTYGTGYTLGVLDTQVVRILSGANVIWQAPQNETPTWAVSAASGVLRVNRGASANKTLALNYLPGFSGSVALAAANLPAGVSASFLPASLSASGNSVVTLAVSSAAPPGTTSFTVRTTSNLTVRPLNIPLTIGLGSTLAANTFLASGQYIVSPSGNCHLVQEADGNLALYSGSDPAHQAARLWSSNTHGTGGNYYTAMQGDGNLVTYAGLPGTPTVNPVWDSATYFGGANAYLEITDDTSVLLYSARGQLLWGAPTQALTPLQSWRLRNFAGTQLVDDTVSGLLAQPAGDGCSNLLKYATGLAPFTPAPAWAYPTLSGNAAGGTLAFTYYRDTAASDVTVQAEQSTDLRTWTLVAGAPVVMATAGTVQTLRLTLPASPPAIFFRLTVSSP